MKTRWYSTTISIDPDQIMQDYIEDPVDRIVLLAEWEWSLDLTKLAPFCKENNIELVPVTGNSRDAYYEKFLEKVDFDINKVVFFDKHWLLLTEELLSRRMDYRNYKHESFRYPFICMNNRAHYHRCFLIDELSKNNLIEKGVVTWHNFLGLPHDFSFKHYDGSIRTLTDDFKTKLDSFLVPDIYKNCFLDVIGEATHEGTIISEKPTKSLLLKKPFLVLGSRHWYKHFQSHGFKLYDEVFDYSFDECDDLELRTELFVKNIIKIIDKDHQKLYDLLKPKLEYNLNLIEEFKRSSSSIPDIIVEHVKYLKDNGFKKQGKDYRLWDMVDNANILV